MPEAFTIVFSVGKVFIMVLFAILVRIFSEQEEATFTMVLKRTIIGLFIYFIAYTVLIEYFVFSESLASAVAVALAFASREVLDIYLKTLKGDIKITNIVKRK